MASPSVNDDGIFQSPIHRIPTPLGPNCTLDESFDRERSGSHGSHRHSVNGDCQSPPQATPTTCQSTEITTNHKSTSSETPPPERPMEEGGDGEGEPKEQPEKFTRAQIYTLFAICFANLCSSTFYSLLAPFFPTEATNKGASNTEVGIILGVFQGVVFISSPLFGAYLTTFGPRFMFVIGTFATSTCVILFGMLQWCPPGTIYVVMCLLVRSVEALAAASTTTSSQAIAAHTFSSRLSTVMTDQKVTVARRGSYVASCLGTSSQAIAAHTSSQLSTVMGILQACGCVGLMIGPPVGGTLYAVGGFYLPFVVSGGLFMMGGVVSFWLLPPQKVEPKVKSGSKLALLKIPLILILGYLVGVGQLAMGFIDVALAVHLQQFKLHPAIVGLLFLIPPVVVVILAPIVGWVTDKFKWIVRPLLLLGTLVATLGFLAVGPSPLLAFIPSGQLWVVVVGLAVAGLGWSSMVVCFPEFVRAAHDKGFPDTMETQGVISGLFNAFNSIGALIGPTLGGFLLQRYKFGWSSTMVAGCTALAFVLLVVYTLFEMTCSCNTGDEDDRAKLVDNEEEVPHT